MGKRSSDMLHGTLRENCWDKFVSGERSWDTYRDVSWRKFVNVIPNYTTEDGSVVGDAGKIVSR